MRFILLTTFILSFLSSREQVKPESTERHPNRLEQKRIIISFGEGVSQMTWLVTKNIQGYNEKFTFTPVYNGVVEVGVLKRLDIGLALSYQSLHIEGNVPYSHYFPGNIFYRVENTYFTNSGVRAIYHFGEMTSAVDEYAGIRAGCTFVNDWINNDSYSNVFVNPYEGYILHIAEGKQTFISMQVFGGIRGYLSKTIGLHVEAGLGLLPPAPYIIEAGVTFKFQQKASTVKAGFPIVH